MEDKDGFVSIALGLTMYAPFVDEPDLDESERAEPAQKLPSLPIGITTRHERKRLEVGTR